VKTSNRAFATRWIGLAMLACTAFSGCSSLNFYGVPANRLPQWLLGTPRATQEPINLIRLRQDPPTVYQLGPRDILGIFIQGVLGREEEAPPVHFPQDGNTPPALGFPIPIREDGTLALPLLPEAVKVSGMTLGQAEAEVRQRYIDAGILIPGRDRIIVTMIRKRTYQVIVVREDLGAAQGTASVGITGPSKRGSAFTVDLEAYENDVMHALAETGGLPGLDAKNEVTILRGSFADAQSRAGLINEMVNCGPYNGPADLIKKNPNVVRIPLRAEPGRPATKLTEEDIILTTGDILFIETRERDVFYTGGQLAGREIPLPRDYDLDVLAAISLSGGAIGTGFTSGSLARGSAFGQNQGQSVIPATQITIIRKLPNGGSIPIRISLDRALVDPSQRILIQPGDYIILQYTPFEVVANVILSTFSFNYFVNRLE
jgi:protein involved in polysaccharide export with SLBB domain